MIKLRLRVVDTACCWCQRNSEVLHLLAFFLREKIIKPRHGNKCNEIFRGGVEELCYFT